MHHVHNNIAARKTTKVKQAVSFIITISDVITENFSIVFKIIDVNSLHCPLY